MPQSPINTPNKIATFKSELRASHIAVNCVSLSTSGPLYFTPPASRFPRPTTPPREPQRRLEPQTRPYQTWKTFRCASFSTMKPKSQNHVPARIAALHKHRIPLHLPTYPGDFWHINKTLQYPSFCKDVLAINTARKTVPDRPTTEAAYVHLLKDKASKLGFFKAGHVDNKLEAALLTAIRQINGDHKFDVEAYWRRVQVTAKNVYKIEQLNIQASQYPWKFLYHGRST